MILMVDNYDSFTYNLVQAIAAIDPEVRVVRNDAFDPAAEIDRGPAAVVISPGPGVPEKAGRSIETIRAAEERGIPLLGVCLGHQAIAVAHGAVVDRAPVLMHGKTSRIRHCGEGIFQGLSNPFEATRYHSLAVREETLPDDLEITARSEDGIVMGLRHRTLPVFGVQFHPESILSVEGPKLIANFLRGAE
ncbi:MAG TPA: aminodeoxychorismate/anthranilate synthase component II [Thermoanaerobaculia bacterium]|nr:aminodeoxychorismate/anthranilate synthase component II [Thermoanaerobaculia bacterium]